MAIQNCGGGGDPSWGLGTSFLIRGFQLYRKSFVFREYFHFSSDLSNSFLFFAVIFRNIRRFV